jgi:hypothetical protein
MFIEGKSIMKKVNFKTMMSTTILGMFLAGCGGADKILSEIEEDIKAVEKNRSSIFTFINATNDMVNFYSRPLGITDEIYSSEYEVASILEEDVSEPYTYKWNEHLSRSELAITDSVSLSKKDKITFTIENDKAYSGISWLDNNKYSLSIVSAVSNPSSDNYAIRFFSTIDQNIFIGTSDTSLVASVKGEITAAFNFDNCADLDIINDNESNFCQIANAGESYIVVIGLNGKVTLAQESF